MDITNRKQKQDGERRPKQRGDDKHTHANQRGIQRIIQTCNDLRYCGYGLQSVLSISICFPDHWIDATKRYTKEGDLEKAEIFYLKGLELDAGHLGINEYLGELYVNTNRTELAKKRLDVLNGCKCEEYEELKELIENN